RRHHARCGAQRPGPVTFSWPAFEKVDMRGGVLPDPQPFPEARRPALKLWIDFGPELGTRRSSAQITAYYTAADLIGRRVIAVVNFAPKQIGPFVSEVLVMGAYDPRGEVVLLNVDQPVAPGSRIGQAVAAPAIAARTRAYRTPHRRFESQRAIRELSRDTSRSCASQKWIVVDQTGISSSR